MIVCIVFYSSLARCSFPTWLQEHSKIYHKRCQEALYLGFQIKIDFLSNLGGFWDFWGRQQKWFSLERGTNFSSCNINWLLNSKNNIGWTLNPGLLGSILQGPRSSFQMNQRKGETVRGENAGDLESVSNS